MFYDSYDIGVLYSVSDDNISVVEDAAERSTPCYEILICMIMTQLD